MFRARVLSAGEPEPSRIEGRRRGSGCGPFETDGEVPIDRPGLWSLHCVSMRPHSDKDLAAWESFFATIPFVQE